MEPKGTHPSPLHVLFLFGRLFPMHGDPSRARKCLPWGVASASPTATPRGQIVLTSRELQGKMRSGNTASSLRSFPLGHDYLLLPATSKIKKTRRGFSDFRHEEQRRNQLPSLKGQLSSTFSLVCLCTCP